ncbi:MAG: nucleotidyltransferase family protein [Bacteroidota bacterium]
MEIKEAIILAGGLGTRLSDTVPDLPKCMAPVNGRPFISYVVNYLQQQGINWFIFSLGYRSEAFIEYLAKLLPLCNYEIAIETEPLGTGGAIQFAATYAKGKDIVVVNGDSIFKTDLAQLADFHFAVESYCTLALKPMENFERYGVVELNPDQTIASFKEKQFYEKGLINGGVYILNIPAFFNAFLPEKFSFETDYLQEYYSHNRIFGVVNDGYFIDIGIPEDYNKAQTELN